MICASARVWICTMVSLLSAGIESASDSTLAASWCAINPPQPMRGGSVQVAENKIHIVLASKQGDAKQQLARDAFVKINREEMSRLVRNANAAGDGDNFYLVRASAFYVDQDYNIKSRLEAYLFPEEKLLQIVNISLSQPDTMPRDIAIVVQTSIEIQRAEITCLTAT